MSDAEITVYNAGRRLFEDASEPVSRFLAATSWPGEWLTAPEAQAAHRLGDVARWEWLRRGWFDAMVTDATMS